MECKPHNIFGGIDIQGKLTTMNSSSRCTIAMVLSHLACDESLSLPFTGLLLSLPMPCIPEPYTFGKESFAGSKTQNHRYSHSAFEILTINHAADTHFPLKSPYPGADRGGIMRYSMRRQPEKVGVKTKVDISRTTTWL